MKQWISQTLNISGKLTLPDIFSAPVIYIKVTAPTPDTWQLAGNIYFMDAVDPDNLLVLASEIFLNMTQVFTFPPGQQCKIVFRPVRYLGNYSLEIGVSNT